MHDRRTSPYASLPIHVSGGRAVSVRQVFTAGRRVFNRRFSNCDAAGRLLARRLISFRGLDDVVMVALPPGGAAVALPVALALEAQLDVCIVRKFDLPGQEELGMGAIGSRGNLMTERCAAPWKLQTTRRYTQSGA
jgi:predicted phosphoribosyltransferase